MHNLNKIVTITLAVVALIAIGYLVVSYNSLPTMTTTTMMTTTLPATTQQLSEHFNGSAPADMVSMDSRMPTGANPTQMVNASENIELIEQPQGLMNNDNGVHLNQLPSECYPKDVLSSVDLLPRDSNSLWAQINPSGQGSLADQNFLTAGFHIGINTVGQTLRNANKQLRSEPLNPQVKVSPWMQTTIEPDINRRPLEIQGDV